MESQVLIAVIDDSAADQFLIAEALARTTLNAQIISFEDGEQAINYIEALERKEPDVPCPDLVLLDLNLPRVRGAKVLECIRQSETCKGLKVIVVSTSDAPEDRAAASRADAQFRKPNSLPEYMMLGGVVEAMLRVAKSASGGLESH